MNPTHYERGAAAAFAQLALRKKNNEEEKITCVRESEVNRISAFPATRISAHEEFKTLNPETLENFKLTLPPKWRAMYEEVEAGRCSPRFASGLLKLANIPEKGPESSWFENFAIEIAVHELAAFASFEDRRMQLRIKKKIPPPLFHIWEIGIQSEADSDLRRFFRDAYINLNQLGLQHIGFYIIAFSKVGESQPAFESYVEEMDPRWRDLFLSYRSAAQQSSRRNLADAIWRRILQIVTPLKEAKS